MHVLIWKSMGSPHRELWRHVQERHFTEGPQGWIDRKHSIFFPSQQQLTWFTFFVVFWEMVVLWRMVCALESVYWYLGISAWVKIIWDGLVGVEKIVVFYMGDFYGWHSVGFWKGYKLICVPKLYLYL